MKGQRDTQGSYNLHSCFWKFVRMKNVLSVWVCPGICLLIYSQEIVTCARYDPEDRIWWTFFSFSSLAYYFLRSGSQAFLHPASGASGLGNTPDGNTEGQIYLFFFTLTYIFPSVMGFKILPLTTWYYNVCKKWNHQYRTILFSPACPSVWSTSRSLTCWPLHATITSPSGATTPSFPAIMFCSNALATRAPSSTPTCTTWRLRRPSVASASPNCEEKRMQEKTSKWEEDGDAEGEGRGMGQSP